MRAVNCLTVTVILSVPQSYHQLLALRRISVRRSGSRLPRLNRRNEAGRAPAVFGTGAPPSSALLQAGTSAKEGSDPCGPLETAASSLGFETNHTGVCRFRCAFEAARRRQRHEWTSTPSRADRRRRCRLTSHGTAFSRSGARGNLQAGAPEENREGASHYT